MTRRYICRYMMILWWCFEAQIIHHKTDQHLLHIQYFWTRGKSWVSFFFLPVRFMLHLAEKTDGIIVTNDNLRDFVDTSDTWRRIIQERWLLCIQLSESFTYVLHYLTWHWKVHTGAMLRLKFYLKPFYLHLLSISESFIGKGTWEFMCVQETKRVQHF